MKILKVFLRRIPLTLKMVILTLFVGIFIWAVLDYFVNKTVTHLFKSQLTERLNMQSTAYRYRFGRYISSYSNLALLISKQKDLIDYVSGQKWSESDTADIIYYRQSPSWLPGLSTLRNIAIPRYALLIDSRGNVREIYQSKKEPPPEIILRPSNSLLRRSEGVSYLTSTKDLPYLITSEYVHDAQKNVIGTLMLAGPLDSDFLLASQGQYTESLVIGIVTNDTHRVIVSSNTELLPPGSTLGQMYGQNITLRQRFFEYGDSEMSFKFASLVPKKELSILTDTLVSKVRQFRALIAIVFIASFVLITFFITRRISRVTQRITDFSHQLTGDKIDHVPRGDQLYILEESFNRLTKEVTEAREIIKKQAEEKTRLIVDQAFEAIITIDMKGFITSWNPRERNC